MKKLALLISTLILASVAVCPVQAQEELIYVAVEPCRVADTRRSAEGFIKANTFRNFLVAGTSEDLAAQGGVVDCLNPKATSGRKLVAVAAYIIAVPAASSTGNGVLSVYPSDQSPPPVGSGSTVNFAKGQTTGNTTIATLCTGGVSCPFDGQLAILSRNSDEDVVVDVQGYFFSGGGVNGYEILERAVDLSTYISASNIALECPAGKVALSGGHGSLGENRLLMSLPSYSYRPGEFPYTSRSQWNFQVQLVGPPTGAISFYVICANSAPYRD